MIQTTAGEISNLLMTKLVMCMVLIVAGLSASCSVEDVELNHQDGLTDAQDASDGNEVPPLDVTPEAADQPLTDNMMEFDWLDGYCGGMWIELTVLPTNVMFVIDRSSSMLDPADGHIPTEDEIGSCSETNADPATGITYTTRWDNVCEAVKTIAAEYEENVNFGLVLFPGPGSLDGIMTPELFCTGPVASPKVMVEPHSESAGDIQSVVDNAGNNPICSGGFTPARYGLIAAIDALNRPVEPGPGVIILATDGAPNCNPDLPPCSGADCTTGTPFCDGMFGTIGCLDNAIVDTISEFLEGEIKTYVIGIPGSEEFSAVLDAMAVAGGTARSESPKYYEVSDRDELISTLGVITDAEISCVFELDSIPENTNDINVLVDDQPLRRDDPDGFVYNEEDNTIELLGRTCEDLKSGGIGNVKFLFGCRPFI